VGCAIIPKSFREHGALRDTKTLAEDRFSDVEVVCPEFPKGEHGNGKDESYHAANEL